MSGSIRKFDLATALSSLGQGPRNWDWLWTPAKAYDGICAPSGWDGIYPPPGDPSIVFAASYTNEDHNGFGFTLNFNNSTVLTMVQIAEGKPNRQVITQWCLEYWNGSAWIRWGVFDSAANRSGQFVTLVIDNTTIASHNWRVYATVTDNTVVENWYGTEITAYQWGQQPDISVVTLSLENTSVLSDKWRVYATATTDEYSNWYGTELEVWGSDTALPNTHSFNWVAKGIRLCKVP